MKGYYMKIIIEAEPKEIVDLVRSAQERSTSIGELIVPGDLTMNEFVESVLPELRSNRGE